MFKRYHSLSLFLIGLFTFSLFFLSKDLVDIDRPFILDILESYSWKEFFKKGIFLYDVAFIRDFILFFLGKLKVFLGFQVYGFFNYLLWFSSIIVLRDFFEIPKTKYSLIFLGLVLCHPMMAWVIGWPTAVKHLLSLLFATLFLKSAKDIKEKKKWAEWCLLGSYFFLLNTWPINILIPFSLVFYFSVEEIKKYKVILVLLALMAMFYVGINFFYFREVYPLFTAAQKFAPLTQEYFAESVLGISRGITQVLFPVSFATFYNPGSIIGLLGFISVVPLVFLARTRLSLKETLFLVALSSGPFIVVYGRPTNVFVSDPYYILPLCVVFIGLFYKVFKYFKLVPIVLILFSIKTFYESSLVIDPIRKITISYEREGGCKNGISLASIAMKKLKLELFLKTSRDMVSNKCIVLGATAPIMTRNIYSFWALLEPNISYEKKIKLLKPRTNSTRIQKAIYLKLLNQKEDIEAVLNLLDNKLDLSEGELFIKSLLSLNLKLSN